MAGEVRGHLSAIKSAYRDDPDEGDHLVDELAAYAAELENVVDRWLATSSEAAARQMEGHGLAASVKRTLTAFRLSKP